MEFHRQSPHRSPSSAGRFAGSPVSNRHRGGLRIVRLCGMFVLVLALMGKAGNPDSWRWMWQLSPNAPDSRGSGHAITSPSTPTQRRARAATNLAAPQAGRVPIWLPQLDRTRLQSVQDNTVFRPQETQVWFYLLGLLRDVSPSLLQTHSNGRVTYLQLLRQTDAYRGQIVEVRGTMRRAVQVRAAANDLGIQDLWQCWLFLHDGPREPVVVYALHLPESAPRGTAVEADVALQGFVYKRWSFQSAEGLTVAPVLLANTVELQSVPNQSSPANLVDRPAPKGLAPLPRIMGLATLGLLTAMWLMRRANRRALSPISLRRRASSDEPHLTIQPPDSIMPSEFPDAAKNINDKDVS